ncbi:hypothetical protein K0M31_016237, partial [Melipona bicolor]
LNVRKFAAHYAGDPTVRLLRYFMGFIYALCYPLVGNYTFMQRHLMAQSYAIVEY